MAANCKGFVIKYTCGHDLSAVEPETTCDKCDRSTGEYKPCNPNFEITSPGTTCLRCCFWRLERQRIAAEMRALKRIYREMHLERQKLEDLQRENEILQLEWEALNMASTEGAEAAVVSRPERQLPKKRREWKPLTLRIEPGNSTWANPQSEAAWREMKQDLKDLKGVMGQCGILSEERSRQ
jgi:hypothetical protein